MTEVKPVSSSDAASQPQEQKFSNEEIAKELAREVNLRNVVYPSQIRAGRLSHAQAERQTAILRAAWEHFKQLAQADKDQREPPLQFGESAQPEQPAPQDTEEAAPQSSGDQQ